MAASCTTHSQLGMVVSTDSIPLAEAHLEEKRIAIALEDSPNAAKASLSIARLAGIDSLGLDGGMGLGARCLITLFAAMVVLISVLSDWRTMVSLCQRRASTFTCVSHLLFRITFPRSGKGGNVYSRPCDHLYKTASIPRDLGTASLVKY